MGKNLVRKTYTVNGSWTAPAGVTTITVRAYDYVYPLAFGEWNGVAIDYSGRGHAWGRGDSGQIGNSVAASGTLGYSSPQYISGGSGLRWRQIAIGSSFCIGIADQTSDVSALPTNAARTAYGWGINTNGQLGLGDVTARSAPVVIIGNKNFSYVDAGTFSVGIDINGLGYAWGINTNGNLGVGDVTPRSSPVAILRSLVLKDISVSGDARFGACVDSSGAAYGWGINTNGQLGVGDVTPRSSPVAVLGSKVFKKVRCGENFMMGLDTSGALWAWGMNAKGQLGDGTTTVRSSPVAVVGGKTWIDFDTKQQMTVAIDTNYDAYSWGDNTAGGLGLGDVTARSSPVAVLGSKKWNFVTVGSPSSASAGGLASDGNIYAWGMNLYGNLGVGNTTPRSSPVIITGNSGTDIAWKVQKKEITKQLPIDVVPGTTYTITFFGKCITFGNIAIESRLRAQELVIEYFT